MHILAKPLPACLSVCALVGITKPSIFASTLKLIANVPEYIKAYENVKSNIGSFPQKEDGADTSVLVKQENKK